MILVDANLLLYARDSTNPDHAAAAAWLTRVLNGPTRVGLPWQNLLAFARIATHPRVFQAPLTAEQAWGQIDDWLAAPAAWVPLPTERHGQIVGAVMRKHDVRGVLVPDAELVALALEHGLEIRSANAGFAQFDEVRWSNPLGS